MGYKQIPSVDIFDYQVISDKEKGLPPGVLCTLKGPATFTDKENRNKRIYPSKNGKSFWERVLDSDERLKEKLDTKTFFGNVKHPGQADSPTPELDEVSHAIRDYTIDDKGTVDVTLDILDTVKGRGIKTLVDYGSKLGISTRAYGEEEPNKDGIFVPDEKKYHFVTWDLVAFPAFSDARMTAMNDSAEFDAAEVETLQYGFTKEEIQDKIKKMIPQDAKALCDFVGLELQEEKSEPSKELDAAVSRIVELEDQVKKLSDVKSRPLVDFLEKLKDKKVDNDAQVITTGEAELRLNEAKAEYKLELDEITESYDKLKEEHRLILVKFDSEKQGLLKRVKGLYTVIDSQNRIIGDEKRNVVLAKEAFDELQAKMDDIEVLYEQVVCDLERSINEYTVIQDQLTATEQLKILDGEGNEEISASTVKHVRKVDPLIAPLSDSIEGEVSDPEMDGLEQTINKVKRKN